MKELPMDISTALNQQYGLTAKRGSVALPNRRVRKPAAVVSQSIVQTRKPTNLEELVNKIRANELSSIQETVLKYAAPSLLEGVRNKKFGGLAAVKALKSVNAVLLADCIRKLEGASAKDRRALRSALTKAIFNGQIAKLKECYATFCHEPVKQELRMQILLKSQDIAAGMDDPMLLNCLIDAVCYECELDREAQIAETVTETVTDTVDPKEEDIVTSEDIDTAAIIEQAADEKVDAGANILQTGTTKLSAIKADNRMVYGGLAVAAIVGLVVYRMRNK
jgi:hypothetical protein